MGEQVIAASLRTVEGVGFGDGAVQVMSILLMDAFLLPYCGF